MAAGLVVLAAAGVFAVSDHAAGPSESILAVSGRRNANVSLAAQGSVVAAAWAASLPGGPTDIYAALSSDNGTTFSPPVRVNAKAGDTRITGEQPPKVALLARAGAMPVVIVVWTSGDPGTAILVARSNDGAQTFGPSTVVPNGQAPGLRGWESITVDAHGAVQVLWLDHRDAFTAEAAAAGHDHGGAGSSGAAKPGATATAEQSKLYFATLGDPTSGRPLLGSVCFCCKTSMVNRPDGVIYAAWRHVYPGGFRDMVFTLSRDGGRTFAPPTRVSDDKWQIDGCPEDGPSMAIDTRNQIHIAWPTLVAGVAGAVPSIGLFYARSLDGRLFSPRLRIPTEGVPHHPQLQVVGDSLIAAWDELTGGARHVVVGRASIAAAAQADFSRHVVGGDQAGVYPALAVDGQGALIAWTATGENSSIRVSRLDQF